MEKAAKAKKTGKTGPNRSGTRNAEKPLGKATKIAEKPEDNAGINFPDKCDCFIGRWEFIPSSSSSYSQQDMKV